MDKKEKEKKNVLFTCINLSLAVRSDPLYGYVIFDCRATAEYYKCNQGRREGGPQFPLKIKKILDRKKKKL
jgi:hypothetical protein